MIRIFRTASGIKKTACDSVLMARKAAFIIISRNSLESALSILEGIILNNGGSDKPELIEISFFIKEGKKELIRRAEEYLSKTEFDGNFLNVRICKYGVLSGAFLKKIFNAFDLFVFFLALGATVRLIAPFIKDKLADPAVIVIDESRKFAISLLSGHTGGGNEFAAKAANFLGAIPVITTATDVSGKFSLDMFAKSFGFFIEDAKNKIKEFNKASLNGEKFIICIKNDFEADKLNMLKKEIKPYIRRHANAKDFRFVNNLNESGLLKLKSPKIIAISMLDDFKKLYSSGSIAILRPKTLVVGIGCNKNTSFEEIEDFILSKFAENNLSINAIRNVATIDLKKEEKGILKFGEKYAEFIDFFTKEEINGFIKDFEKNEKSLCFKYTGAYSVSEPCAVLSAKNKTGELLIYKQKRGNVTMAVSAAQ
ncbi:MAG: cobalt-precorrin 5A hydrolase [bacterium]